MAHTNLSFIRTLYFSATGTTEKTVLFLAEHLSASLGIPVKSTDFTSIGARDQNYLFSKNELLIVGVPVYAGRVPNVLLPFLSGKLHGENTPAVSIVLYGNRNYDDALLELNTLLKNSGCIPFASAAMIGEHSFSTTLASGRPDHTDFNQLQEFEQHICKRLRSANPLSPVSVPGSNPIRPYYTPRDHLGNPVNILKVKPVTDTARCTQCGFCSQICPMGSIEESDCSKIPGICIKCCACVKKCPHQAKYFADDKYLYHQHELEAGYTRRAEPEFYY